ncbi:MAG TPA: sugar phosphate isomerase/epimerase family protein [Acidobacteriota bacterium]|nr:sugar phosphate isomerase/epimerase family protein [Acidobacteriota bacterium]
MDRRAFLCSSAGALCAAALREVYGMNLRFRYSSCNEMFEKREFAGVCRTLKAAGFAGIEIAPFTLADSMENISVSRRRELRDIIHSEGLEFAGLHWLLLAPKWLHVTTADRQLREKSWAYFSKIIDLCADLGDKGVMVFGSPKQRGTQGNSRAEASTLFRDGLASVAPHAGDRGVTILIESLPSKDTDVVNTLAEAAQMVREIDHPAIQTMFDFHNTVDEHEPLDKLVRQYFPLIRHVHINEMDGRYPGSGGLDFRPVFRVLADLKYSHWVSVEVFEWKEGPDKVAQATMEFLRGLEKKL